MPTVPSQSHFRFSQVKSKWGVIYQLFCCLLFSCKDLSKHLSRLAVGRKVIHMGCVLSMELCALSGAMCSVRGRVLCMELCALSGAVYSVWGCVLCMGPCALYGAMCSVWGCVLCMGLCALSCNLSSQAAVLSS